jgi:hypothetical protein
VFRRTNPVKIRSIQHRIGCIFVPTIFLRTKGIAEVPIHTMTTDSTRSCTNKGGEFFPSYYAIWDKVIYTDPGEEFMSYSVLLYYTFTIIFGKMTQL